MSEDCHDVIEYIASQVPEDIDKSHGEFIQQGYAIQGTGHVIEDENGHQVVEDFQFFSVSVVPGGPPAFPVVPSTQVGAMNTNITFSSNHPGPSQAYSVPVNPAYYAAAALDGPAVVEKPEPVEEPGRISEMNRLIGESRGRKLDI